MSSMSPNDQVLCAVWQAGVSMVLSFMILWDLTTIRAGVTSLRTSRLAPVYEEIAPSFAIFGTLFGKALQAQVALAMLSLQTLL